MFFNKEFPGFAAIKVFVKHVNLKLQLEIRSATYSVKEGLLS